MKRSIATKLNYLFTSLVESSIRNIGGPMGMRIRERYYSRRFKHCGKNLRIDINVIFENANNISVGHHVHFLPHSIITARPSKLELSNRILKVRKNKDFSHEEGELIIGNEVGIGAYNIIQGYGGLYIGNRVTTSARVSIYSFSHYFRDDRNPSLVTYSNSMIQGEASNDISCISSPIVIEEGVWLGLNTIVFGGTIGKNTFTTTNAVVVKNIPENSYASGSPAIRIRDRFAK